MEEIKPLAERLDHEDTTVDVLSTIAHPSLVELCGELGLDFVWLDLEHGGPSPWDAERIDDLARAAALACTEAVVRIPTNEPALVRKVLDTGVRNVLVPRVETAADVRRAVAAAHFSYDGGVGHRGLAGVRANRWGGNLSDYTGRADREVCVGVMIETERAVSNLESILAVEEFGFAFIGPWDLSHSLGHPLDEANERVQSAVSDTEEACRGANVPVMGFVDDAADAAGKADAGYQLLVVGSDVDALRVGVGAQADAVTRKVGQTR